MGYVRMLLLFLIISTVMIVVIFFTKNNSDDGLSKNSDTLEVKIIIKDHKFIPETLEVPSNTKIRLIVTNQDDTVEEFESHDLHREKIVMPNDSITIILAPLAPGKYDFFGDFHQETARGSLVVH